MRSIKKVKKLYDFVHNYNNCNIISLLKVLIFDIKYVYKTNF